MFAFALSFTDSFFSGSFLFVSSSKASFFVVSSASEFKISCVPFLIAAFDVSGSKSAASSNTIGSNNVTVAALVPFGFSFVFV